MVCALFAASLLALSAKTAVFFQARGIWIPITVTLALEPNVGATKRKATLRLLGTFAGGLLALLVLLLVTALTGGWLGGSPPRKVVAMSAVLSLTAGAVQYARSRFPAHDYAFVCMLVTLTLASLSEFVRSSWQLVLRAIAWRVFTIALGGLLCFLSSSLVFPEYASDVARERLGVLLADVGTLLCGVIDAYTPDSTASRVGSLASEPESVDGSLERRPTWSRWVAQGFTGDAGSDGVDTGLLETHAPLHALEATCAASLDALTTLIAHAKAEAPVRLCARSVPLAPAAMAAAARSCRAIYTGAVTLLHGMESGLHHVALCAAHSAAIRTARAALADACTTAAAAAMTPGCADTAAAAREAFGALEAAVAALASEVAAERAWLQGAVESKSAKRQAALRNSVQALGAVCFTLGDAARQLGAINGLLLPPAAAEELIKTPGDLIAAPGGAFLSSGGGAMGRALRDAAAALDAALHWHHARSGEGA